MFTLYSIIFWAGAALIVYAYVFYAGLLAVLRRLAPPRPTRTGDHLPTISIIIAAYNEERAIEHRIKNCLALDYPAEKLQILIASDGSSDRTNELAQTLVSDQVQLLKLSPRQGKVNALNAAVPESRNEILIFSDATSEFAPELARELVKHFADDSVGCVCGNVLFKSAEGSRTGELEGAYWRLETYLRHREGERGCTLGATGAAFAMRRSLWQACPRNTLVEDLVIPMNILAQGYRVNFEPKAIAIETAAVHVEEEFERRRRIGAGAFQSLLMLRAMLNPFKGFPAFAYVSHKVLRWLTPILMLTSLACHFVLARESKLYQVLLIPHLSFYGLAFIGHLVGRTNRSHRILSLPYYFVSMNLALLLGYVRFLRGSQKVTWNQVNRV